MGRLMISSSQMCISREQEEFLERYRTISSFRSFLYSYGFSQSYFLDAKSCLSDLILDGSFLPYDYRVSYLESDILNGFSYIDTGIPNDDISNRYFLSMEYLPGVGEKNNSWLTLPGASNIVGSLSSFCVVLNVNVDSTNYLRFFSYYGFKYANLACSSKQPATSFFNFEICEESRDFIVNGERFSLSAYDRLPNPDTIKLLSVPGRGHESNFRLYGFSIVRNFELLMDLIPVVKDNIGYMYDRVSGKLFGAQGGGFFIVGPRI